MSDKVFWSILGAILVGWIAVFVLLVMPQQEKYSGLSDSLDSRVTAMRRFAGQPAAELPGEALLTQMTQFESRVSASVTDAGAVYAGREDTIARAARSIGSTPAQWIAAYRDAYNALATRYRSEKGLGAEDAVPFPQAFTAPPPAELLPLCEKHWRVEKLVVEKVLEAGGDILEYKPAPNPVAGRERIERRGNFEVEEVSARVRLPSEAIPGFLAALLGHETLTLELGRLEVGKDEKALIHEIARRQTGPVTDEPDVGVGITLNVLTWAPPPEVPPEDE